MPNQTGFGPLNGYYIGCCNTLPNDGFWAARMHWIWCRDSSNGRNSAGGNAAAGEQRFPWLEAAAIPRRALLIARAL